MSIYKALNYWVYGGFEGVKSPEEFIQYAERQRLDGVELTVGDALNPGITDSRCAEIRKFAAAHGIGLRSVATGFFWGCSPASPDAAERRSALDFARRYLEIAAALGAESALIVPGAARVAWDPARPVVPYRQVWELAVESITELIPVAERLGVNIALENVWNRFLMSPMEWKLFLDQFSSDRVGMYFDVGNCCLYAPPEDYADLVGKRIKAVHLKNFTETDCAGGLHGFGDDLLKGEVNFPRLFAALEKIGYTGPYTVEMIPFSRLPDLVLPDAALADATAAKLRGL